MLCHLLWHHRLICNLDKPLRALHHRDRCEGSFMTTAPRPTAAIRLKLGDWIEWEDERHQVIGFLDTAVRLRSQGGSFQVIVTAELLADPTFRTADAVDALRSPRGTTS